MDIETQASEDTEKAAIATDEFPSRRLVMSVRLLRRRFTVEEYHRMAQAGILSEDDHVELIDGEIVEMPAIGSRHAACVDRLTRLFSLRVGEKAIVRVQSPIRLGPHTEPQPDLTLLRSRPDFYASAHPPAEDVLLAVEVADASIEYDRTVKIPLYARAGIVEAWVVDLAAGAVEVNRVPTPQGYRDVGRAGRGDALSVRALAGVSLTVAEVIG